MRKIFLVWTVSTDPVSTRTAYEEIQQGAAARCGCAACRNFDAARPQHYPEALDQLLSAAAVDPRKEAAARLVAPLEGGFHLYSGTYPFFGQILKGRPHRGFPALREEVDVFERVATGAHVALRPWERPEAPWSTRPCVSFEVLVILPWVLENGEAGAVNLHQDPSRVTS